MQILEFTQKENAQEKNTVTQNSSVNDDGIVVSPVPECVQIDYPRHSLGEPDMVKSISPNVSSQYTGKAGETAVISELLFYGFNASAMAVDDGIDVIAGKNNKYFHIQVKTSNQSDIGGFVFSIKKSSFVAKDSFQTFYIFVIRAMGDYRYYNDYLILPSSQIRQLIEVGIIKDSPSLSIRVQIDRQGRYILNAKQNVTISVNTFSQIA